MNEPHIPREPDQAELLALDAELDRLATGGSAPHDPALTALSVLAHEVDLRTALLIGGPAVTDDASALLADEPPTAGWGRPRTRTRRAHHRHGRWVALPLAAGLTLTSVGTAAALSSSPHEPLYALHTLLFGGPTPASRVDADLAAASKDLAAFATAAPSSRPQLLRDATRQLRAAQALVGQVQDPAERSRLTQRIEVLSTTIAELSGEDEEPSPAGSPGPEDVGPQPSHGVESDSADD